MNFNALEDYDEMQLHNQLMHQSQTIIKLSVYVAVLTASYLLSLAYLWHRNWPSHLTSWKPNCVMLGFHDNSYSKMSLRRH